MKLFEPITIRNTVFKNRMIMPGMDTNLSNEGGFISEKNIKYYELRARGGVGAIIVEAAYFDKRGRGTEHMISLEKNDRIPGLTKLSSAIKKHDAKAFIQIYHAGAQATAFLTGLEIVAPSAIATKTTGIVPKPLTKKEIQKIVKGYAAACERVKKSGFDGVEIHAGHGYLIGQFFSPLFNKRTDEYGGSLENRTRFAKEVLHAVRKKCGTNFIIIMRLNCRDYIEGGLEIDDMATIACEIEKEEIVDIFNITAGVFDSPFYPVVPYMSIPRGVYSEFSKIIKEKLVKTPVSVVGRINTPEIAEKILLENRSDMVTVGRALIADPFFPQKISENNLKDIRYCIGCNACLNQIMIEEPVACAVNVNFLGTDEDIQKTTEKKKILIIGAGPAGLETARVCAIRGHDVQLIDKASKIGGSLNAASSSPLKNEIKHLINYYDNELSKLNVKINLETTFSESTLESFKPDIAVITVGSECLLPEIKGLVEKGYYSYKDVLKGKIPDGKRIAILGGGMIGLDVADYLADKDKEITILEESKALGSDLYALVGVEVAPTTLKHTNINAELDFTIAEIKNNEIIGKREDQEIAIGFDDIVIALAKKTDFIYEEDLIEKISKVFKIGDCKKPRKIKEAIEEGYNLGLNIDTAKGIELMDMQSDNENDIKQIIIRKIKDSSFNISDIPLYLEVMVEICNTNEKIQKKSSKIKLQFQFSIENGSNYWIKITNGHFTTGEGKLAEADVSIIMQKSIAAGIFTGEVNATSAYMRKQIKFLGSMRHGLKFQQWTNAVTEELGLG